MPLAGLTKAHDAPAQVIDKGLPTTGLLTTGDHLVLTQGEPRRIMPHVLGHIS